ncbi:MAG: EF-hand domain-containing protein [Qingshengfaniella sp.]
MKRITVSVLAASLLGAGIAGAQDAPATPGAMTPGDRSAAFIERFDTDGDGAVTAEEMETYRLRHFTAADANGDGMLSAEELAAMSEMMAEERQTMRVERMLERFDANGDGMLSADELPGQKGQGRQMQGKGKWGERHKGDRGHCPRSGQ